MSVTTVEKAPCVSDIKRGGRTMLSIVDVATVEKAYVVELRLTVGRTAVPLVEKWSSVTLREKVG